MAEHPGADEARSHPLNIIGNHRKSVSIPVVGQGESVGIAGHHNKIRISNAHSDFDLHVWGYYNEITIDVPPRVTVRLHLRSATEQVEERSRRRRSAPIDPIREEERVSRTKTRDPHHNTINMEGGSLQMVQDTGHHNQFNGL